MSDFVLNLDAVEKVESAPIGGKAFNLAKLAKAGFPVPPGFCITANAYSEFMKKGELLKKIHPVLEGIDWSRVDHVKRSSLAIRESILQQGFPAHVRQPILAAWQRLCEQVPGEVKAAVRSSAAAEDRADLSFAGQYDTFLGICTEDDLLSAVRKCWASLWSERALTYYKNNGLDGFSLSMAVLVQQMVDAAVSGVMFTANPVNQDRDQILIHAAWGLGEAVAAGKTLADEFLLDKEELKIKTRTIREKQRMVVLATGQRGGTVEREVPEERRNQPTLTARQVLRLARFGKEIEALFAVPQDIEWAVSGRHIFILQSRPITTLLPIRWGNEETRKLFKGQVVYWSNFNTRETLPYPLTPLSASYFMDLLFPVANKRWLGIDERSRFYAYGVSLDLIYNRLYWNMNMVFNSPLGQFVKKIDHEAGVFFENLHRQGRLFVPRAGTLSRRLLFYLFLFSRLPRSLFLVPWFCGHRAMERRNRLLWRQGDEFEQLALDTMSYSQLLHECKERNVRMAGLGFAMLLKTAIYGLTGLNILETMCKAWPDIPLSALLAGIEGNTTTAGALALYKLSTRVGGLKQQFLETANEEIPQLLRESEEGKVFAQRLAEFLRLYGHRAVKEFDIGHPRWNEDPSFVWQMIKNYLQLREGEETPLEHFEKMRQERERLTALALKRLSPLKRWLFKRALQMAHFYIPQRENNKYYALKFFSATRRVLLEIGSRFCEQGLLQKKDDIFFFTLPELESFAADDSLERNMNELVVPRKLAWEKNRRIQPPFIIRSDGKRVTYGAEKETRGQAGEPGALRLHGAAASGGRVTGLARVIMDPADNCRLNKGEILVAPFTDPGWTPLFLTAKALVMDTGGIFSHGAVVAREYGIPAVVGVKGASARIKSGDQIMVDGDEGVVELCSS